AAVTGSRRGPAQPSRPRVAPGSRVDAWCSRWRSALSNPPFDVVTTFSHDDYETDCRDAARECCDSVQGPVLAATLRFDEARVGYAASGGASPLGQSFSFPTRSGRGCE